ncbi:MAG: hypothetical protein PHP86_15575 [Nevskiales bacterium]|nr:hypothetical protein [Nevskiales bacterium]
MNGISAAEEARIVELVGAAASTRDAVAAVRGAFPRLRATPVDALDVRDETPARSVAGRSVYWVESDGHCRRVTASAERADGLLLAEG